VGKRHWWVEDRGVVTWCVVGGEERREGRWRERGRWAGNEPSWAVWVVCARRGTCAVYCWSGKTPA
jgi:hypothetical protein